MDPNAPGPTLNTTQVNTTTLTSGTPPAPADPIYPPGGPDPKGANPLAVADMEKEEKTSAGNPDTGLGIEGEEVVWEGTYSMKNFLGRLLGRGLLTVAWIALAVWTWGYPHRDWAIVTGLIGVVLLVLWGTLIYRMLLARYGHYYRLTNRRLFISSGLMRRRRDQLELLRIEDVFTRQSFSERWLSLGTVVVVSSEKSLPTAYLTGVDDPKRIMDLVWHYARKERDERSIKMQSV